MKKKRKVKSQNRFLIIAITSFIVLLLPLVLGLFAIKKPNYECANSISCVKDLSGKFDEMQKEALFMGKQVSVPALLAESAPRPVLGETSGEKVIRIDLTNQKLYAYEGDREVYSFLVSTGKWGATPTGEFRTWVKLRATLMAGGSRELGTYYYLPNVQYTMYFYNNEVPKTRGYGIHGTYWHNNFGHPMSHGCINMKTEEAAMLFAWANPPATGHTTYVTKDNPGTKVIIYGTTPNE